MDEIDEAKKCCYCGTEQGNLRAWLGDQDYICQPCEAEYYDSFDDEDDGYDSDRTCPNCHGTGGEPYDDHCTPCDRCDGEGYLWWT